MARKDVMDNNMDWLHHWRQPDGEISMSVARSGNGYCLRFPTLADFYIPLQGDHIFCTASPEIPEETIRHLLLDQVIPRITGQKSHIILHASSVEIDGRVVAFLGEAGQGKSTLAGSLHNRGYHLVGDDSLLVQKRDFDVYCIPGYCGLRLYSDTATILENTPRRWEQVAHYSSKKRLILHRSPPGEIRPKPLAAIFVIRPFADNGNKHIDISPLSGADVLMQVLKHALVLNPFEPHMPGNIFLAIGAIARSNLAFYTLAYPHKLDLLPVIHEAIFRHLDSSKRKSGTLE